MSSPQSAAPDPSGAQGRRYFDSTNLAAAAPISVPRPPSKKPNRWHWIAGGVGAVIALIAISCCGGGNGDEPKDLAKEQVSLLAVQALPGTPGSGAKPPAVSSRMLDGKVGIGANEPPLSPASQQNAVRAAREYLGTMAFSRSGLIKQLQYDGYVSEDATYAVDIIAVDWNAQAAKAAREYLGVGSFSYIGLVKQLQYDGFTSAQAQFGATAAGL